MNAVLLAEPEPSTREFLQRHLADDGFDVLGAEAEREALELVERLQPSLVLSSPELCRRLREGEPGRSWNREVPVIVLGGSEADTIDRVRAFDRGCDDYVPRPSASLFTAISSGTRRRSGHSSASFQPSTNS